MRCSEPPNGRVHDEVAAAAADEVDDRRLCRPPRPSPPCSTSRPGGLERPRRPAGGDELEPEPGERSGDRHDRGLVGVAHREERRAARSAAAAPPPAPPSRTRWAGRRRTPSPRRSSASPARAPGSLPGKRANGRTAALTLTCAGRTLGRQCEVGDRRARRRACTPPRRGSARSPSTRTGPSATRAGWPRARRPCPSATASWTLIRPTVPSAGASRRTTLSTSRAVVAVERRRGQHAGRVARVDARLLDVLHHGGDVRVARRRRARRRRSRSRSRRTGRRAPCRSDPCGTPRRPRCRGSRPASRARRGRTTAARAPGSRSGARSPRPRGRSRRSPTPGSGSRARQSSSPKRSRSSARSIGVVRRAEDPEPGGLDRAGELQRRLAAELDHDALRLLALADGEHLLDRRAARSRGGRTCRSRSRRSRGCS